MKKEFIDFLYEMKAKVQAEIDVLVDQGKEPIPYEMEPCVKSFRLELEAKRNHIKSINDSIQKYLDLH